jgi:hypothetical protein
MIGPLAAGGIIVLFPGFTGYRFIFSLTFVLFLFAAVCTQLLPPKIDKGRLVWQKVFSAKRLPGWRKLTYSFTALHFRDDVLSFFLWIFMYTVTLNEASQHPLYQFDYGA